MLYSGGGEGGYFDFTMLLLHDTIKERSGKSKKVKIKFLIHNI
jgi:hypothetical protein